MTPSSNNDSPSDRRNKNDLLKAIGNPAASEEEWLSACETLGNYHQPPPRKKNIPLLIGQCAAASALMTALVYGGITLSSLNNAKPVPAPVAPAPVAAAPDVDFGPYMADLQRRIKRAWFPPRGNETKRVKVRFKVHSDGKMDDLKIVQSAHVAVADTAALKAVENAAPFKALPQGASENVDIEFTFDYNVFAGHKRL